jgi:cell division protein FtsZ
VVSAALFQGFSGSLANSIQVQGGLKMSKTSYVPSGARIKVVGMGGGGCNAITRMVREQIRGVEFIAMNTDAQHLTVTEAAVRIQLGERVTRGLGAGGDHIIGQKAAEESRDDIKQAVTGADMVFVTCGMGGGTGTGSIPLVAQLAKQSGALTIAVVTKPFSFEGTHRNRVAEEGITDLMDKVDTLIIIPNDRLLQLCDQKTNVNSAFKLADEVLFHGVQAIAEVVTVPGLINLDFADVRTVMKDAGPAWMSIGHGTGQNRARDAAKQALASPLLDVSIEGAKGVLFNIAGGSSLTLFEVNDAAEIIRQSVDPEANVIFGVVLDQNMGNEIRLTLIATGFATREALTSAAWEKEVSRLLKGKTDEELDVPSFLRYQHVLPGHRSRPTS